MIYPGGWNDLKLQEPKPISPIIAMGQIYDGANTYEGVIVQSTDYFAPSGGNWVASPFALNAEPKVLAVNAGIFVNEVMKATAMNQQTKMSNFSNAPPPMSNVLFLYGNRSGDLKYQMQIELDLGAGNYPYLELSVMENAAGIGGSLGVVEAYHFAKVNFTGVNTLYLLFDNYFGLVNLGLRAEDTLGNSSIFEMRCIILNADVL